MDLHKLIKDSRETLRDSTIRTYLLNIKRLNGGEMPKSIKFMENVEQINEKIKDMKLSTKRNMITSIMVVLSAMEGDKYLKLREEYRKELAKYNSEYESYLETHSKTMKEETNWTTVKELNSVLKEYMRQIRKLKLNKKELQPNPNLQLLQKALVAGLYLIFNKNDGPRRLEYANMKIIKNRSEIKPNINYLLFVSSRTKYFVFQNYKTSGTYGTLEKKVPTKLNTLINNWLRYNKSDDFLLNNKGGAMSANSLGKYIPIVFQPSGKKITLNLIRHIFISENVELDKIHNNKALAENMGHDISTQEGYIKIDT